ncbi:MAG: GNAT family acetyltransferase [Arthrobacter sp.]|nr:GNAT family acetyltransferase [Arthrobacter sp.]
MTAFVPLVLDQADAAAALWEEAGLVRPWNDPRGDFARAVVGPTSAVLGLVEDGELIASAMVGVDGHRGWVYYVAVAASRRGRGLGRAAMEAAEAWLLAAGAPKVQLMVRGSNAAVLGFYARLGYADQDTVVLGKFLDPELEALRRTGA